jgi:hypothetical protein
MGPTAPGTALILALAAVLLALPACGRFGPAPSPAAPPSPFTIDWDPATGKGAVVQAMPGGDRLRICLQCRYAGYAGGLWIGSQNGPGFRWQPQVGDAGGLPDVGLFCAQDESIVDLDDGTEYAPGWSENVGRGDDGVKLAYVEGAILDAGTGPDGVVLRSVNRAGGLDVTKYLSWPRGAAYVVIASRIRNTGDRPRRLALWTGDDPWVGRYSTSEGDIGWTADGLVLTEARIPGAAFKYGGVADLGNPLLGDRSDSFSGVANLIIPDPSLPPPDVVYFANGFAHSDADIDPLRALEPWTPTAINLGWTAIDLAPGRTATFRYALGRADIAADGLPIPPPIPPRAWGFDAVWHEAFHEAGPPPPATPRKETGLPVRFAAERIVMTVEPGRMRIDARYEIANRTDGAQSLSLLYPFPIDADHPAPDAIEVDGVPWRQVDKGIIWRLDLAPGATKTITVRYAQACLRPAARYILTTTGRWGAPLGHAAFEVRWPSTLADVRVSYPGTVTDEGPERVLRFDAKDFRPDRDLAVTWSPAYPP